MANTKQLYTRTYNRPGNWMNDDQLDKLRGELSALALHTIGEVPDYGAFSKNRDSFRNRLITVVYHKPDQRAVAFSAMVYMRMVVPPSRREQTVVHLGLVMVAPEFQGKKIAYWLNHQPTFGVFKRRLFRPYWITSTTMEPVIFGSVSDGFSRVYPNYRPEELQEPTPQHLAIARAFYNHYRHEIGMWEGASFDEKNFVFRGSSQGTCESLIFSYEDSAKYRKSACNEYCRDILHYDEGDEFIQVGRADFQAVFRSAWWFLLKLKRRFFPSKVKAEA